MKSYKKADLSLSVNAIVVLILAIVMLGLALGFVKTMFGKTTDKISEFVEKEPEPELADATKPITLSRETIIIPKSETTALKFSVYNTKADLTTAGELIKVGSGSDGNCLAATTSPVAPLKASPQVKKTLKLAEVEKSSIIVQSHSASADVICQICSADAIGPNCADVRVIIK